MKKLVALSFAAGMFAVTSCGPSAEEIAAKEKAKQDSIQMADTMAVANAAAAEKAKADSIAAAEMASKEKAKADSTRMADSLAALKKNTPKSKPKPKEEPKPKAGQGKG